MRNVYNSKRFNLFSYLIVLLAFSTTLYAKVIEEQSYLTINGAKIYYQSFGKGEPIIVLHGGPGLDSEYLLPQMTALDNKYKVIFYDQRGSGKSTATAINEQTINMPQFVADLNALIAKLGYTKVVLMGHSWGGLLAMNYAIKYPSHVKGLILVNGAPATRTGFLKFVQEYDKRVASISLELTKIQNSKAFMTGDPKTIENYYRLIFSKYVVNPENADQINFELTKESALAGMKVAAIMQKKYLSTKFDLLPILRTVHIPTLIIHGIYDVVPLETAQEIHKAIQNSELVVLQNTGSFAYIEQPEEFFASVNAFLEKIETHKVMH